MSKNAAIIPKQINTYTGIIHKGRKMKRSWMIILFITFLLIIGTVSAIPVAKFTADPLIGEAPLTVTFADTSGDATIVNWLWDFGDGTTGPESKPFTHVYETAGEYTVTLTVVDEKGEKASENQLIKVTAAEAAVGTATVITWDENKIIVNYNVDGATCAQGCFLKILHDDYGYPICWFDFDISDKLKGTIETAPIETRMEIKRYTWYVTIEPKENRMIEFDDPSKIKLPPIFKLTADKMPKSITADPRYKT
jgi:hypothetical protein